jgi:hypothetical protein
MEDGNHRAHGRRWHIQSGLHASTKGTEIDRRADRYGLHLLIRPDYHTGPSVWVSRERCLAITFIPGDRVRIKDRLIVGQVAEVSGDSLVISAPSIRFPDGPQITAAANQCEFVEIEVAA